MNILAQVKSVPRATGTDALHYCILMLEQAELPENWKRDEYFQMASRVLEPEAVLLGRRMLSQIEAIERACIDRLDTDTLHAYTRQMGYALDELYEGMEGLNLERGAALLREMRASPV